MNIQDFLTYTGRAAASLCGAAAFLHWQNTGLRTARYTYSSPKLPASFKGFKIRQISDYHNTANLENKVVRFTRAEAPDIIAVTGDLFDCRKTDIKAGVNLVKRLAEIAPVYMVCGNHEAKIENIEDIKKQLVFCGAIMAEDKKIPITKGADSIIIAGVPDPQFAGEDTSTSREKRSFRNRLLKFFKEKEGFTVLLSHRPEFIHTYRDCQIDLALTGHAHGGQFGIPFTDIGVLVPNQGLFPPYAAGLKKMGDTTEIISRGIGNSVFPFRLFNFPEVVTVEFE